jgi:small subunit ribosomal protein S16
MLSIRLARTGKKHQAYFRVVVADSKKAPTAKFVEIVGNYDPHAKVINLKKDRIDYYLSNGAQPSNTVAVLLKKDGVKLPDWVKITEKNRAPKKVQEEVAPAAAPKAGEPEVEAEEASPEVAQEPAADKAEETAEAVE